MDSLIEWSLANQISVIDLGGDATEHLAKVTAAGIQVGSVDLKGWQDLISDDKAAQDAALAANEEYIAECAKFGVTNYFAVMLPKDPAKPRNENFALMVESLNLLAKILEKHNGRLVIEGWPGPGALCCTPESYRACLEQTPACIGINFDPSHLLRMGVDPHRFLEEFADRVYHVHGKDCAIDREALYNLGTEQPATFAKNHDFGNAVWRYTIPGHGETRWKDVFTTLSQRGYKGAVSIELEDENFNGSEAGEKQGILVGSSVLASA
jgi:sugar phosphate isomerase/epimerase